MRDLDELVASILVQLQDTRYVIVKMPATFPFISEGSDIDIFALGFEPFVQSTYRAVSELPDHGRSVRVSYLSETQAHIDVIRAGTIEVRLDVYCALPEFSGLRLRPLFFSRALDTRIGASVEVGEREVSFFTLEPRYDAALRICEYANYYWSGPDKIHHIEAILELSATTRVEAIGLLHEMTDLPDTVSLDKMPEKRRASWISKEKAVFYGKRWKGKIGSSTIGARVKKILRSGK